MKVFTAVKAFIVHNGKVLLIKESGTYKGGTNKGKFDVVGGKINPGEKVEEALLREVKEETGLHVKIGKPFFVNEAWPQVNGEQLQIVRIFFECTATTTNVTLSEDHDAHLWIDPKDYKNYNIIENLFPAFEAFLH